MSECQIKINALEEAFLTTYETGNINDPDFQMVAIVNVGGLARKYRKALNALLVIVNTLEIRDFLTENDPKAYEQAVEAIIAPYK